MSTIIPSVEIYVAFPAKSSILANTTYLSSATMLNDDAYSLNLPSAYFCASSSVVYALASMPLTSKYEILTAFFEESYPSEL